MKPLERVMDVRKVKKPGQYFLERNVISKDKEDRTVRKTNEKMLIFMAGKCPTCGNTFFSEYDPEIKPELLPCASKECTTKFMFLDGGLQYEEPVVQETRPDKNTEDVGHQSEDKDKEQRQNI